MKSKKLSHGLDPFARAQNAQTGQWHLAIRYRDPRGETLDHFIPSDVFGGPKLSGHLANLGIDMPAPGPERTQLLNDLRSAKPKKIVLITKRHGWQNEAYVTGHRVFNNKSQEKVYYDGPKPEQAAGTMEEWQREVAEPAGRSSLGIFAICVALSPPLMRFTDVENGVFHVSGPSGAGKTTFLKVAESVWRNPEKLRSWDTSKPALNEQLESRNDSFIAIDEIGRASSSTTELRGIIGAAAYLIGGGTPRSLSSRYTEDRPPFRVFAMSSGEVSATEIARRAGDARFAGEEARLIDLDIAELGKSIFDRLDAGDGNGAQASLADGLNEAVKNQYGHAAPAFIARICKDTVAAAAEIEGYMHKFLNRVKVADNGWERRIAKRFALVFAAGALAAEWGVVPWREIDVGKSVVRVYRAAQRSARVDDSEKGSNIKDLSSRLDEAVTFKALKRLDTHSVNGFLHDEGKGQVMIATEVFDKLGDRHTPNALLNDLDNAEILVRGRGDRGSQRKFSSQRSVTWRDEVRRGYFYVFDEAKLHAWLKTAMA